jgi:hypothetical protein
MNVTECSIESSTIEMLPEELRDKDAYLNYERLHGRTPATKKIEAAQEEPKTQMAPDMLLMLARARAQRVRVLTLATELDLKAA